MSFIKNQLSKFSKYLEKLKEQKAFFGAHTPPHILVEIDEIEEKIKELNKQVEKSEKQQERFAQITIDSSEAIINLLDVLESIEARIDKLSEQLEASEKRQNQIIQSTTSNTSLQRNNFVNGSIVVRIAGANNTIRVEIGTSTYVENISIGGANNRETIYVPNVSNIIIEISGANNAVYAPRTLLERVIVRKSGANNQIIAI